MEGRRKITIYWSRDETEHFNPQTDGWVDKSDKRLFALLRACNAIYNGLESEKSCCDIASSYIDLYIIFFLYTSILRLTKTQCIFYFNW